jgi:hypothetical protein
MSYYIYSGVFTPNEQLHAAKLDNLVDALNLHDHSTTAGNGQPLTIASLIAAGLYVSVDGYAVYA